MKLEKVLILLVVVAFIGVTGRALMSAPTLDFVDGTKIPETLIANHIFSAGAEVNGLTLNYTVAANGANTITSTEDVIYIGSGSAATLTLPTPTAALIGKVYTVVHNNGTTATTISAAPYSINGATTDTTLNAAYENAVIICTGPSGAGGGYIAGHSSN